MSHLPTPRFLSRGARALLKVRGRQPYGGTSSLFMTLGAGGVCGVLGVTAFAFAAEVQVRKEADTLRSEAIAAIETEQEPLSLGTNRSVAGDLILTAEMERQGAEHLAEVETSLEAPAVEPQLEATPQIEEVEPPPPSEPDREDGSGGPTENIDLGAVVDSEGTAEVVPVYDTLELGSPLALISIPKMDLEYPVVFGDGKQQLKVGIGQVPGTPSIGTYGNAVLAGHRTSNGAPFYDLDLLEVGDQFSLSGVFGVLTYEVNRTEIVTPDDVASILTSDWTRSSVTLFSCTPRGSTSHRLLVHADLVGDPINLIT